MLPVAFKFEKQVEFNFSKVPLLLAFHVFPAECSHFMQVLICLKGFDSGKDQCLGLCFPLWVWMLEICILQAPVFYV